MMVRPEVLHGKVHEIDAVGAGGVESAFVMRCGAMGYRYGTIGRLARKARLPADGGVVAGASSMRTCVCDAGYFDACGGAGRPSRLRDACRWCLRGMGVCACRMKPCTRICMCCRAVRCAENC